MKGLLIGGYLHVGTAVADYYMVDSHPSVVDASRRIAHIKYLQNTLLPLAGEAVVILRSSFSVLGRS